ncbi:tetratricopeptide repeat-containing sensor histidine kinase [Xanthocytophaga agilis]|uniref:histidine kinase n=1 Tax=Xanthocytophaga agilis TaxID=3048010 RepID=A0AAE3UJN3_9BACT|nr:ATP-binding protein [Xanthocytophaga agilis]MDJ1505443.1 tetratricopeptide repeat protein [Xanthocytophaga agilis]
MKRRWVIHVIFWCSSWLSQCYGQSAAIDSLKHLLRNPALTDTLAIIYRIELAYQINYAKTDTAYMLATDALRLAQQKKYTKGIARAYHALGYIHSWQGNEIKALDSYLKSIPLFETVNDKRGLSVSYSGIAKIYEQQQQINQALKYYQKAYALAVESNFKSEIAQQLGNIGVIYNQYYHRPDTALTLLKRAIQDSDGSNNQWTHTFLLENMGYTYYAKKQYTQAIQIFSQALAHSHQYNQRLNQASVHKALALTFRDQGDLPQSMRHALTAMDIAQEIKDNNLIRGCAFLLSTLYERTRNFEKALTYQRIGENAKEQIYNTEKTRILNNTQTKYDLENQQRAIALLNKEKLLQNQELEQKTFERNASIIGSILITIIAGLFYLNFRHQQRNNTLLTEKTNEIANQKEQLLTLNATKDKLFSIVSHDIRSPLNSMEATLLLLEEGSLSSEELAIILPELRKKVHTTSDLLANILQWARSQMEGIITQSEPILVWEVACEQINSFQSAAQEKNITITNLITPGATVFADRNMVALILRNLISNAIKFTPQGGRVTLQAEMQQSHLVISVQDTGKGMTQEQKSRLFDMKTHFSTHGTANEAGTGLGLLLCKEFVEKNNGSIWVESEPNRGSRFFISLPAA